MDLQEIIRIAEEMPLKFIPMFKKNQDIEEVPCGSVLLAIQAIRGAGKLKNTNGNYLVYCSQIADALPDRCKSYVMQILQHLDVEEDAINVISSIEHPVSGRIVLEKPFIEVTDWDYIINECKRGELYNV